MVCGLLPNFLKTVLGHANSRICLSYFPAQADFFLALFFFFFFLVQMNKTFFFFFSCKDAKPEDGT